VEPLILARVAPIWAMAMLIALLVVACPNGGSGGY
jgi:hypothetical protein